jgi:hypothetical protein
MVNFPWIVSFNFNPSYQAGFKVLEYKKTDETDCSLILKMGKLAIR